MIPDAADRSARNRTVRPWRLPDRNPLPQDQTSSHGEQHAEITLLSKLVIACQRERARSPTPLREVDHSLDLDIDSELSSSLHLDIHHSSHRLWNCLSFGGTLPDLGKRGCGLAAYR